MREKGVGVQLYQFCSGLDGRTFANGTKIVGGEEAIKAEMRDVWTMMRGERGKEMRSRAEGLRAIMRESREKGEAKKSLDRLGRVIMGEETTTKA